MGSPRWEIREKSLLGLSWLGETLEITIGPPLARRNAGNPYWAPPGWEKYWKFLQASPDLTSIGYLGHHYTGRH